MPEKNGLIFEPAGLDDYDRIWPYTSVYGEGSCQHSPVSMYSLSEKYGDSVCVEDGFLYTLRSRLCDDTYRVYLAPMGGGDLKGAYLKILEDAAANGRKAKFQTLTEKAAAFLSDAFPGRFEITENRDYAEYFCLTQATASFAGGLLKRRRREAHNFWHLYGDRVAVTKIRPEDHAEILDFEEAWLAMSEESHDTDALRIEYRMIRRQMEHYEDLRLSGIVLRIDGKVEGFGYGTKLNDRVYDVIVEKGNRSVQNISRVLRQEATRQCAMDCEYVNIEEDVGVPGLRALKNAYCPEYLLRKFVAIER